MMHPHPLTLAAERRKVVTDRYIVEFRLSRGAGLEPTRWFTPQEEHLPESVEEVLDQIAEHHPLETGGVIYTFRDGIGHMRVTKLDGETDRFRDVTEDMMRAYGHRCVDRGWDWPQWAAAADDREVA